MASSEPARIGELRRHALGGPSARSLLFTLLGEYVLPAGGAAWAGTLVAALGLLGVEEKAARQAISRTAADGWLDRERVGRRVRWRLTDTCERLLREGARRIYAFGDASFEWDGRWVIVLVSVPQTQRDVRHRLRVRLTWAGFSSPAPGVWLSPHADREEEAKRVLENLGLDDDALSFVGHYGTMGPEERVVHETWDLAELEAAYEAFIAEHCGPGSASEPAAFVHHTRLVHEWRRFPFVDPELPRRLLPRGWIGFRAHEEFLRRHAEGVERATAWFRSRESREGVD